MLAQYAGAGLDDLKDWNEENLRRIAEHLERTDFDAIREDYDAGVYDDFLWPADEDEAEFLARFQPALGDRLRLSGVPVEGPPEPTFHPVTNLFPPMAQEEFHELVEDIRAQGLLTRIWLDPDDRSIIDGRHRYRACREAGVQPEYQIWAII